MTNNHDRTDLPPFILAHNKPPRPVNQSQVQLQEEIIKLPENTIMTRVTRKQIRGLNEVRSSRLQIVHKQR